MILVLDASMALSWAYQDEIAENAGEILRQVIAGGAWVPGLWRIEVANGLRSGIRRGRITADYRDQALSDLSLLKIEVDAETDRYAWLATIRLSDRLGITPYDAAYIELALRRSLPLASLDKVLCLAAQTAGVVLV